MLLLSMVGCGNVRWKRAERWVSGHPSFFRRRGGGNMMSQYQDCTSSRPSLLIAYNIKNKKSRLQACATSTALAFNY